MTSAFLPPSGCAASNRLDTEWGREGLLINFSLISVVQTIFRVYSMLIVIRVIMSWLRLGDNVITRFIYEMTEPFLGLFRRIFPPRPSFPLDFSPLFALIALNLLQVLVVRLLLLF